MSFSEALALSGISGRSRTRNKSFLLRNRHLSGPSNVASPGPELWESRVRDRLIHYAFVEHDGELSLCVGPRAGRLPLSGGIAQDKKPQPLVAHDLCLVERQSALSRGLIRPITASASDAIQTKAAAA